MLSTELFFYVIFFFFFESEITNWTIRWIACWTVGTTVGRPALSLYVFSMHSGSKDIKKSIMWHIVASAYWYKWTKSTTNEFLILSWLFKRSAFPNINEDYVYCRHCRLWQLKLNMSLICGWLNARLHSTSVQDPTLNRP